MFDIEYKSKPRRGILKSPAKPLPSGCAMGSWRPWVTAIRHGIAYSDRCECDRGDYFRAKDEARRQR